MGPTYSSMRMTSACRRMSSFSRVTSPMMRIARPGPWGHSDKRAKVNTQKGVGLIV